jgi:hypothetical protein
MSSRIERRNALRALLLLTLLVAAGLIAWGPWPIGPDKHHFADTRSWLGVPNALNVLVNLPLFWLAVWGWCATRASDWPKALRVPWQWFHLFTIATALGAAAYHAAPSDAIFVASHVGQAGAFTMLAFGVLAERADARFGSNAACAVGAALVLLMGATALRAGGIDAATDMRPLALLETIPVLLIPAGALSLRGSHTHASNWLVVLALYASSKLFDVADAAIFDLTGGFVSGHSLMHLNFSLAVGWMAYFASANRTQTVANAGALGASARQTSLKTSG